jgi:hypothetical protein
MKYGYIEIDGQNPGKLVTFKNDLNAAFRVPENKIMLTEEGVEGAKFEALELKVKNLYAMWSDGENKNSQTVMPVIINTPVVFETEVAKMVDYEKKRPQTLAEGRIIATISPVYSSKQRCESASTKRPNAKKEA